MQNIILTIALYGLYAVIAYAGFKLSLFMLGSFGPIHFMGELYLRSELKKQGINKYIDNKTAKSMAIEVINKSIKMSELFKNNPRQQMMSDLENLGLTLYLWILTEEPFDDDSIWNTNKEMIIRHNIKRQKSFG